MTRFTAQIGRKLNLGENLFLFKVGRRSSAYLSLAPGLTMFWTAALLVVVSCVSPEDFCYNEPGCDPYAWGDLIPSCHPLLEEHHSPINVDQAVTRNQSLGSLHLVGFDETQTGHWMLENDGHHVVLHVGSGMSVSGGGLLDVYHTIQLHFHWGGPATNGSEHTVDRRRYPMEMHVVNMKAVHLNFTAALEDPTGLAVLGIFIDVVYADNVQFGHISQKLSSVAFKGQTTKVEPFPLMNLLPKHNMSQYYRYHGSLTTPPCSRAVVWTLYEVPIYISWSQLTQFTSQIFSTEEDAERVTPLQNNFRHIHPTFSRVVSMSKDARLLAAASSPLLRPAASVLLLHVGLLAGFTSSL